MLGVPAGAAIASGPATRDRAVAALCRAEADRLEERDDPAGWLAVAEAFEAFERPYPAAYARFRAGGATLRERGPRTAATTALRSARSTAARLGARPLLAEIDLLARQARLDIEGEDAAAGADGPSAAAATALDLTAREREVLELIAAGWSNQQIADALFISRKTASVHASHIFDKLGAANRVEAAAIAHRLGLDAGAPPPPGSVADRG